MFRFFVLWALATMFLTVLYLCVSDRPWGAFLFSIPAGFIPAAVVWLYQTRMRAT